MKQPYFLVIEDDEDEALLFQRARARVNPERPVVFRVDAASAMTYLEGCLGYERRLLAPLPALIVLDLKLDAAGSGFDFLRKVREHAKLRTLTVLVFSGSEDPRDRAQAEALGALRFVSKPTGAAEYERVLGEIDRLVPEV
jgi:two-component system, response regulator